MLSRLSQISYTADVGEGGGGVSDTMLTLGSGGVRDKSNKKVTHIQVLRQQIEGLQKLWKTCRHNTP